MKNIRKSNSVVPNNIVRVVRDKGIKQTYVAEKAGYTSKEFSDMMNGRRLIRVCDIPKLALALGVTPNDLLAPLETDVM